MVVNRFNFPCNQEVSEKGGAHAERERCDMTHTHTHTHIHTHTHTHTRFRKIEKCERVSIIEKKNEKCDLKMRLVTGARHSTPHAPEKAKTLNLNDGYQSCYKSNERFAERYTCTCSRGTCMGIYIQVLSWMQSHCRAEC